jgi:hypothetical protein
MKATQDKRADLLRHFPTLLSRWVGASARMTELTIGHRTLTIELRHKDRPGRLVVACVDPEFIHGPTDWSGATLVIELAEHNGFVLRDDNADLLVRAGKIELKEHL